MASARKKSAPSRAPKKSKPAPKPTRAKAKPAGKPTPARSKPAARPAVKKPVPAKAKAAGRGATAKAGKPAPSAKGVAAKGATAKGAASKSGKPLVRSAKGVAARGAMAKGAASKSGKPLARSAKGAAVKGASGKGVVAKGASAKGAASKGGKPLARPAKGVAAKGAALKGRKPVPPPVKAKPPRLVPATAEARAAAALAARASKPGAKNRGANRPEPEVRPLGVLPLSSQAKPRDAVRPHPVKPVRSHTPPRGTPKPQPARKGDERLTEDDLKYFEQRLLTERRRIMAEMGHIEATVLKVDPRDAAGEQSGYSFHMADAGTDSMEREKAFDIASKEGRLLLEIDEALRRLYNGTYGLCEISGKPISRTRLDALPWARLSIDEQEKLEREKRLGRMVATDKE